MVGQRVLVGALVAGGLFDESLVDEIVEVRVDAPVVLWLAVVRLNLVLECDALAGAAAVDRPEHIPGEGGEVGENVAVVVWMVRLGRWAIVFALVR